MSPEIELAYADKWRWLAAREGHKRTWWPPARKRTLDERIVDELRVGPSTASDVSRAVGCEVTTARNHLRDLARDGEISVETILLDERYQRVYSLRKETA